MTILLLGGRGKTTRRLASILSTCAPEVPFLVASRTSSPSSPYKHVKFDWFDESTWAQPFNAVSTSASASAVRTEFQYSSSPITGVYIVGPPILDMVPLMKRFIDFARGRGVRRFVLLSSSVLERGGFAMGQVHDYLAGLEENGVKEAEAEAEAEGGIEWAALRPSWFMENFSEGQHLLSIKEESKIYSATGEGRVPFVSAEDIARVAFRALTDARPHNTEHLILGPELLSYDDLADILSSVLGRTIAHVKLSEAELAARMESTLGIPQDYAQMLAVLETNIKNGEEDRMNDDVEKVTGKGPRRFRDFSEASSGCWVKDS
ncbi:ergot alkaloid biosynthetic protein A, variant [Blastomyces dermatitidis ER-3]|uniref:Ergot alkaloid biosynthetic protein A n=1 Tax=Ajellomyces dermatitidis (strain ER-3 / ATCC MYA-2586) TaxID=559297 RepID=A0ABX2VSF5_AJEDR|nr:ergot alkaloid biosynthetic protein A [Blastomyces dermatitidis ER-3]XP_045279649.1 ergot alkaloid biosynthetic protein A, variant [Blastomyces dermatitidis ER-3]OAS99920.1 ergot alkaloid biosynthetic protein A [Blastomyces dermatitidis ER-3]OAS99921.1 ergot alkaloid biosynthetic protein A, variant [Blastomyces dermatitidis ER-3]